MITYDVQTKTDRGNILKEYANQLAEQKKKREGGKCR